MSTPVQKADDIQTRGDWQITPVIIKTGGGPIAPGALIRCTIGVQDQDFESTLMGGDQWQSAMSVETAAIKEVKIIQDGKDFRTFKADQPGLAVLQITYGSETLIFQEVVVPNSDSTSLAISSSLPFTITPGQPPDEWNESSAPVPADPPFVVFTQGATPEQVQCASTDVEIRLEVDFMP